MKTLLTTSLVTGGALLASAPLAAQGFVERAAEVGLQHEFMTGLDRIGNLTPMADWSQQGVAIGDLDGDGDLDVLAVSRLKHNHLFKNNGGVFNDVSAGAQLDSTAFDNCVALGDHDRDGDLDVFIGALQSGAGVLPGKSRLYENVGLAPFVDVTAKSGTVGNGHTIHAAFVDLDRDGLLDLHTSEFHGTPDAHYRNHGDGTFTEVAAELGLDTGGSTHVTAFFDADGDGLYDVFPGTDWRVSNNANLVNNSDDVHLQGQPDGTFLDVTAGSSLSKQHTSNGGSATMGIAVADVDYDGDFDMYQTQAEVQFLVINDGWPSGGAWTYQEQEYGVANEMADTPTGEGLTVGWGCVFLDADADPWLDLFKVNGHVSGTNPPDQQNYFFRGLGPGASFAFADETAAFGLQHYYDARGLAVGDLDGDGDVDLVTAPVAESLRFYENQVDRQGQGMVAVRPVCNTSAPGGFGVIGSWTDSSGFVHRRQIGADGTTAGQSEAVLRFGVGFEPSVDMAVEFPSGMVLSFPGTLPGTTLVAVEPEMIEVPGRVLVLPASSAAPAPVALGGGKLLAAAKPHAFTVHANAYDASGAELDASAEVELEVPGLIPAGPVVHVEGNRFRRSFEYPAAPGRYLVQATFDGWAVAVRPAITFREGVEIGETTARVRPLAVRAGSADTYEVTVVPRSSDGVLAGAVSAVAVQVPGRPGPSQLLAQGDGTYRGTFPAPAAGGVHPLEVFVDGASAGVLASIEAGGPVFGPSSLYYPEPPNPGFAMMPHTMKVLVTPRDLFGLRLGPGAEVSMEITPDPGTPVVTQMTDLIENAGYDGAFFFVLAKAPGSPAASGTVAFTVDGAPLFTKNYGF